MSYGRSIGFRRGLFLVGLLVLVAGAPSVGLATNVNVNVTVNFSNGTGSSLNILDDVSGTWYNLYQSGACNGSGTIGPISVSATVGTGLLIGATGNAHNDCTSEQTVSSQGQNFTFNFSFTGGANQTQNVPWYWNGQFNNYDPTAKSWKLLDPNGNVVASGTVAGYASTTGSYSTTGTQAPSGYTVDTYDSAGNLIGATAAGAWSTSTGQTSLTSNNDTVPTLGLSNTGTNITWTDGTTGALDSTLKTGLSGLYSATTAGDAAQQEALNAIDTALGSVQAQLSGLQGTVNTISSTEANVSSGISAMQSQLGTANGTLGNINTGIGSLIAGQTAQSTTLGNLNTGIGNVNTALGNFASQNHSDLANLTSSMNGINNNLSSSASSLNNAATALNNAAQGLAPMDADVQASTAAIKGMWSDLTNQMAIIGLIDAGASNQTAAAAASLAGLKSDADNLVGRGLATESTLQGARSDLTTLDMDMKSLLGSGGSLQGTLNAMGSSASATANNTANLDRDIQAANNTMAAQGAAIVAAVQGIPDARPVISQLDSDVNGMNNNLGSKLLQIDGDVAGLGPKLDTLNNTANGIKADGDMTTNLLGNVEQTARNISTNTSPPYLANYATNQLAAWTAGVNATNSWPGATNSAATQVTSFSDAAGQFASAANGASAVPPPDGDFWTVTLPGLGAVDVNPLHNSVVGPLCGQLYGWLVWGVTVVYLLAIISVTEEWMQIGPQVPQARTAGTSMLGVNLNAASALMMAAVIMVLLAAIPAFFAAWITLHGWGSIMTLPEPTAGSSQWIVEGWRLLCAVVPVKLAFSDFCFYLSYRLGIDGVAWVAFAGIKFAVGA